MKYVLLLGFCAVIFLICFLIDKLIQKLFPKHELEKSKTVVRRARALSSASCFWCSR